LVAIPDQRRIAIVLRRIRDDGGERQPFARFAL
jgi:hypothetical protein